MKTAILADDSTPMRDKAHLCLRQLGFQVLGQYTCGADAWKGVWEHHPDLALLDYTMSPMSGIEVAQKIREHGGSTKVIIATANGQAAVLKDAPIHGILIKPFTLQLFRHVLLEMGWVE